MVKKYMSLGKKKKKKNHEEINSGSERNTCF